jgi:hypothetical protein
VNGDFSCVNQKKSFCDKSYLSGSGVCGGDIENYPFGGSRFRSQRILLNFSDNTSEVYRHMKQKIFLAAFLLISLSCLGRKKYTIPKEDFVKQFSAGVKPTRIYCYQEDGKRVSLLFHKGTNLTIQLLNKEEKVVLLHTVTYTNGIVEGVVYNVWLPTQKTCKVNMDEVNAFYVERRFQESMMEYVNIDSSRSLVRQKNDSLARSYLSREEWMISWVPKANAKQDTLQIRENICYHIVFKDHTTTEYGVVQQITPDSIYISNTFNPEWAATNKKEYRILVYAIHDIMQLRLLRSGGYSYKEKNAEEYNIAVTKANKNNLPFPCWFAVNVATGEQDLYRGVLTDGALKGIMEKNGRVYWYEGN